MNLPRDKFLLEKTRENDGWVDMEIMLRFNRLKSISDSCEAICKALKKATSGLIEVHEDMTKIRRNQEKPLPDNTKERKDDVLARSVYVKGFPGESTLDELMDFFEKHGKIDNILMRRNKPKKDFKGSVFVTFSNAEDEDKFLAVEGLKYGEAELIKMKKQDYFNMKNEEEKQRKNPNRQNEKKKAEEKEEDTEKKVEEQMTKGAVLFMRGLPKDTSVEDIKSYLTDFGNVAWVEFAKGDEKALVRFSEGDAQAALEKAKEAGDDGKAVMNGSELELRVVEGEEEKEYWRKMFKDIADWKQNKKTRNFQSRKRKYGGRKHSNRGDGGDGSPQKKAKKTEDDVE